MKALVFAIFYGGFLLFIWLIDRKPHQQENDMRDYSKSRFPNERETRWYEMWIAHVAFAIIMVIGPPIEWVCDRITEFLDRVWPTRPKRPPGRIP